MQEMWAQSSGQEDPLVGGKGKHCSIPAWEIPLTAEPGGLSTMGSESDTT